MQKQSALGSGRVSLWSDILLRFRALINLEIPCITRRLVSTAAGESGRLTWLDNAASFSIVLYGANNIESRKLNSIEIKSGFSCELKKSNSKNQIRVFFGIWSGVSSSCLVSCMWSGDDGDQDGSDLCSVFECFTMVHECYFTWRRRFAGCTSQRYR